MSERTNHGRPRDRSPRGTSGVRHEYLLYRLGGWTAAHPWRTIAGWLAALAIAVGLSMAVGGQHPRRLPGGRVPRAGRCRLPGRALRRRLRRSAAGGRARPKPVSCEQASAGGPVRSARRAAARHRGRAAADVGRRRHRADRPCTTACRSPTSTAPRAWTRCGRRPPTLQQTGVQVELGGQVPENFAPPSGTAELVGVAVALVILVFAFGSVIAAGLPLAVALVGLGIGSSLITLLAAVTDVSTTAPTIASMVGIGVGIDYALLLVTRYVEGLRAGLTGAGGRGPGQRHRRRLGGVRRHHRAGLAVRAAAGRAGRLHVGRLRHPAGRRRRDADLGHPGARAVRAGRHPGAAAPGPARAGRRRSRPTRQPAGRRAANRCARRRPDLEPPRPRAGRSGSAADRGRGRSAPSPCCCCWPRRCWACGPGRRTPAAGRSRTPPGSPTTWSPPSTGRARTARSCWPSTWTGCLPPQLPASLTAGLAAEPGVAAVEPADRQPGRGRRADRAAADDRPAGRADHRHCWTGCAPNSRTAVRVTGLTPGVRRHLRAAGRPAVGGDRVRRRAVAAAADGGVPVGGGRRRRPR